MKKILLTFTLLVATVAAKAVNCTVYVKADTAPFLYGWFTINGKETKINGAWPGKQFTESTTKIDKEGQETTFWYMSFNFEETSSFNIIFNNGNTNNMKQTGNITDIASDRYFTYDGAKTYTDITDMFNVELPDVEIQSVALISELNSWDGLAQFFTEVEPNAKYTYNLSLSDYDIELIEGYYRFKIMVNSSAYLDWYTEGMTIFAPSEWIEEGVIYGGDNGEIVISLEDENTPHAFLLTVTFAGGKDINQGWTLSVAEGEQEIEVGIQDIAYDPTQPKARYNLSGQQVKNGYRGLVISGGKKLILK